MKICVHLWTDRRGLAISSELVLLATLIALGLLAGLTAIRDGIVGEISDVAGSVQDLNQSYSFSSLAGSSATNVGSDMRDATDFCDDADQLGGVADNCIRMSVTPTDEANRTVNAVSGQSQRRGRRAAQRRFETSNIIANDR